MCVGRKHGSLATPITPRHSTMPNNKKLAVPLYRRLLKAVHACSAVGVPLVGVAGFGAEPALNLVAVVRGAFVSPHVGHGSSRALTIDDAFLALRRVQEQVHVLTRAEEQTREVGSRNTRWWCSVQARLRVHASACGHERSAMHAPMRASHPALMVICSAHEAMTSSAKGTLIACRAAWCSCARRMHACMHA